MSNWEQLLSPERYAPVGTQKPPHKHTSSSVSVFSEDILRIIYSSPFRRLQGKTQVHPLPIFDYLRTRLTHTIEVAHVGRSIATKVAHAIVMETDEVKASDVGDIVAAACFAHDLGNPPFGHIGEYAIQTWFSNQSGSIFDEINQEKSKANDFLYFDGNAQGFRILTRLTNWRNDGGLRLSYSVLGAFSKYPYPSEMATNEHAKFGYMCGDSDAAGQIFGGLGLKKTGKGFSRHPLAHIVEAADDICYLTTDIEDAHRMKILSFSSAEGLLKPIAEMGGQMPTYNELQTADPQDRIGYLRSGAVSSLVDAAIETFCSNRKLLIDGRFKDGILENSKYKEYVQNIRSACREKVYIEAKKLEIEAAGYTVITSLLDIYGQMVFQCIYRGVERLDKRQQALYNLLPDDYKFQLSHRDPYQSLLTLIDYVSGMTDRFALDLYQKLSGHSVTLGRMT